MFRRMVVVFLVAQILGGCSIAFVSGPPSNHRKLRYFDCTSSPFAPVADTLFATLWALSFLSLVGLDRESERSGDPLIEGDGGGGLTGTIAVAGALTVLGGVGAYYGFSETSACRRAKKELMARSMAASPPPSLSTLPVSTPGPAPAAAKPPERVAKDVPPPAPSALPLRTPGPAPAAPKPKVAILGLEVIVSGTKVDPSDLQAAALLTDSLRAISRGGVGRLDFAPNSNRELIDEKFAADCDTELPGCMAPIGRGLGADYLIYGNITRISEPGKDGYRMNLKILDVRAEPPKLEQALESLVPLSLFTGTPDAAKAAATEWARNVYAKLAGENRP